MSTSSSAFSMNTHAQRILVVTLASGLSLAGSCFADTFGSGANTFTIDFVNVGNPGNADDRALDTTNDTPANPSDDEYSSPFGGVGYAYGMGVTEVAEDWMGKARNLGATGFAAGAWTGSQPSALQTWYAMAAFVNWLNTSTGHQPAYNLQFAGGPPNMTLWSDAEAWDNDPGTGVELNRFRHKNAFYFLPSEDEWYKAAYHKNDGTTANYWDFPTASNNVPDGIDSAGDPTFQEVFNDGYAGPEPNDVTNVGSGASAYGTRGQGGNVSEWLEGTYDGLNDAPEKNRGVRGGTWLGGGLGPPKDYYLRSSATNSHGPFGSQPSIGFRVASAVPEPAAGVLLGASGLMLLARRRGRCGRGPG